jgi:thioester reductase-like protein
MAMENRGAESTSKEALKNEPLAIVGIGVRLPGQSVDVDSFWKFLAEGRSGIVEVPKDRWDIERYCQTDGSVPGTMVTSWGGFVDNLDKFDARFWGITPREAMRMDPQQRWLLEVAWEAIEDAGVPPSSLRGEKIGVFVGISTHDYSAIQGNDIDQTDAHTNSGSTLSIASNRISYLLDLKGPSLSVDTACSSSLVGVSIACRQIWSGECDAALAGGVNLMCAPHATVGFSKASMLSPDGQCFAFDARANGYVRGEGAGMIYFKRLSKALEDNDRIYAVIRAAVMNQDGHTSSMTVPGAEAQAAMLRRAYEEAGIRPEHVVYMEAHGTGTPVGDPIELSALGRVLSEGRREDNQCLLGSVKSNIGHLEAGSGIAGLIKAALVLHKDQVPPNANFETPNPNIPFNQWKLKVATQLQPLPRIKGALPATAVNSFGFGGTNSHVVLQASPSPSRASKSSQGSATPAERAQRPYVLPISARDDVALRNYVKAYDDFLATTGHPLADICYSAGACKEHHDERLVFLGNDADEMRSRLQSWLANAAAEEESKETSAKPLPGVYFGRAVSEAEDIVFVFTGQGAQWWAMGQELIQREPIFRATLEAVDERIQSLGGFSLIEEMTRVEDTSKINDTHIAQPAIFALQVALAELWKSWGITPSKVVGHSVGEVAAAYVAGIYSLDDACQIIFHRSRLQHQTQGQGKMIAAGVSAREARGLIGNLLHNVQIAAVNSSNLVTMAGETKSLKEIAAKLESNGTFFRWLAVDYPFHTHLMQPIRDELLDVLADIRPQPSKIPFVSTVTGGIFSGEKMNAEYWWSNVRNPVLFAPAVSAMIYGGDTLFLEIGPHPALKTSIEECLSVAGEHGAVMHSLKRKTDEVENILSNLIALHIHGVAPIDWSALNQCGRNSVRLPTYPWSRESYWLESDKAMNIRVGSNTHPLLGLRVQAPNPTWEFKLDPRVYDYLESHRFWNSILFPAAGYGEISLALARAVFPEQDYSVEDMVVKKALFLSEEAVPTVRIELNEVDKTYKISSSTDMKDWDLHVEGRLTLYTSETPPAVDMEALKESLPQRTSRDQYYKELDEAGFHFGPHFKLVQDVFHDKGRALIEVTVPTGDLAPAPGHHFHPILLDACLQVGKAAIDAPEYVAAAKQLYLPRRLGRVRYYRQEAPARFWAYGIQKEFSDDSITFDIEVYDDDGERVCDILGFRTEPMEHIRDTDDVESCLYQYQWELAGELETVSEGEEDGRVAADNRPSSEAERPTERVGEISADSTYILFADAEETAAKVAAELESLGANVILATPGDQFDMRCEADYRRLVASGDEITGIIHCLSLDHSDDPALGEKEIEFAQQSGVLSALKLAHVLADLEKSTQVFFVTRDSQPVLKDDAVTRPVSAAINGLARVAYNENSQVRWKTIDLDAKDLANGATQIIQEVADPDNDEYEIAFRNGKRYVKRIHRVRATEFPKRLKNAVQPDGAITPYQLQIETPGILSNLSLDETQRRAPGPGEVECSVGAAGINFRNVMKALGMPIGNTVAFPGYGEDFAGTVLRVGDGVTHLKPGDHVLGMGSGTFRGYVTTDVRAVFRKPNGISFADAATIPTVFATSYYALVYLARMRKGEKILIHAGTGGVGQAAIQIAKELGLEIFSTAGTPEKRELLKKLGADHVMNSRSLDFVDDVMRLTDGKGVDAVLNSLAADFIPKSLSVLAPFGRFVEIGKVDIYNNSKIGMELLKNNISYFMFDLIEYIVQRTDQIAEMFSELGEKFEQGVYLPLTHTDFKITEVEQAYRFMAQGKHVGKNVLTFDVDEIPIGTCNEDGHLFRGDGSYLITGGASGFGLEVAKWMALNGAGHLVLMSRSGPRDEPSRKGIEKMREYGAVVTDARGDVTQLQDVQRIVDAVVAEGHPPLVGVIHGAMVLRDEFIVDLDDALFQTVLRPKMNGAWNLHIATRDLPLEHFICFSSFSAVIGAPKQSNYNSGNVFLEALAHHRHQQGLAALTINWGALSGAGFVARNEKTAAYLDAIGMKSINVDEALRVIRRMIQHDTPQVLASRADWNLWNKLIGYVGSSKTFETVTRELGEESSGGSIGPRVMMAPAEQRAGMIMEFIAENMSAVCSIDAGGIDLDTPLTSLGLDSLMAVELMNRIEGDIGLSVPMGKVLAGPSIRELADIILTMMSDSGSGDDADADSAAAADGGMAPLEIGPRSNRFALSAGQQTLLHAYHQQATGRRDMVTFAARVTPALDPATLEKAVEFIGKQHPMLRTTITEIDGQPVQRNTGYVDFLTHEAGGLSEAEISEIVSKRTATPFHLDNGSLARVEWIATGESGVLLISYHALVADRASMTIITRDLFDAYRGLAANQPAIVEPGTHAYQDFVEWEQSSTNSDPARKKLEFLKAELDGAPATLNLPAAIRRSPAGCLRFQFPDPLSQKLLGLAAEQEVTLFNTMLSAYEIFLHHLCGQSDLLVGCKYPGRQHEELRSMVGQFENTVVMRSAVAEDPSFVEFLDINRRKIDRSIANQQYPLKNLKSRLQLPGNDRHAIYQASFEMEPYAGMDPRGIPAFLLGQAGHQFQFDGDAVATIDSDLQRTDCELTLAIEEAGGSLFGCWQFDGRRVSSDMAMEFHGQFVHLLEEIVDNPLTNISKLRPQGGGAIPFVSWSGASEDNVIRAIAGDGLGGTIDPIIESTLDPTIVAPKDRSYNFEKMDRILLTGATGFVGAFLIDKLLDKTDADIVCLVRADDEKSAMARIVANMKKYGLQLGDRANRIHAVTGDLTQPKLGLSSGSFNQLAQDIDVIIHNGADVNLASNYAALRDVNVSGSQEVIRLAMQTRLKPTHFVSSYSTVASKSSKRGNVVSDGAPLPKFDDLVNGYAQTKWVVERLVAQAQERGLPAVIYRPGNITGHSVTGVSNTGDIMHTMVLAILHVGAIPNTDVYVDLSPVDFVAGGIIELAMSAESLGKTYHLTNPQPLSLAAMAKWLNASGFDTETMSLGEWRDSVSKLVDSVPGDVVGILTEIMTDDQDADALPAVLLSRFDSGHTIQQLAQRNVACRPADEALLDTYMKQLRQVGFFELLQTVKS